MEVVVLSKEVIGGLAEVLYMHRTPEKKNQQKEMKYKRRRDGVVDGVYRPSRMGEQVEGETLSD
jgi:hypothetical protein